MVKLGCNGTLLCDPTNLKGCRYVQGKVSINAKIVGFLGPFQCQDLIDKSLKITDTIDNVF